MDCGVIYNNLKSFFAKFTGVIRFWNYFPMVKSMDRVHSIVDRLCDRVHGGLSGGASPVQDTSGATGLPSSPAMVGEEEGDEVKLMRGSQDHEWRRRRRTAAARARRKRGRERERAREYGEEVRGCPGVELALL
jgi:hypothetical protein